MIDPSPLAQTTVYMTGIAVGYLLLTDPSDWQQTWRAIRETLGKKR